MTIRVEYQQRGAPHIHMMLLPEDAPIFGIDKYVISFIYHVVSNHAR